MSQERSRNHTPSENCSSEITRTLNHAAGNRKFVNISVMGEYSVANGVLDNRWTPDSKVVNKKEERPI